MVDRIPQPHDIVNDVMRRWPETVWLFMDYGMACGGCPIGTSHTVEDAALEYRIPLQAFLSELRTAVAHGYRRSATKPKPHIADGPQSDDPHGDTRVSRPRIRRRNDRRQHTD